VYAEGDRVGGVLAAWPRLSARQVGSTYEAIAASVWSGAALSLAPLATYVPAVPALELLRRAGAAPAGADAAAEVGRAVAAAVAEQVALCNAALPALHAAFDGRAAPVAAPAAAAADGEGGGADFYGVYGE